MKPFFSIVTITFNASAELPATLRSVAGQTFSDYEHIIVDGASRDNTIALVRNSGIRGLRILSEPDKGLYDAMNKGIVAATGRYLIFLNAGDAFHAATTLQQMADVAQENGYPDIVYGQTNIVDSNRNFIAPRHLTAPEKLTFDSFKRGMLVCHQAFVVRRELAEPYDLRYRFSADYEWCLRCLQKMRKSAYTGTVVIDYLSDGLTDKNKKASLKERYHIMCDYYGTASTLLRHVGFCFRQLNRKLKNAIRRS